MKKFKIVMIMAVFAFIAMLPRQVSAAETSIRDAVKLVPADNSTVVSVTLTLPNAAGERLSSLQLSLKTEPTVPVEFIFDDEVVKTAKVCEARSSEQKGIKNTNIYIAGTDPLYKENVSTLTLGRLSMTVDSEQEVFVTVSDVKLVRGSEVEALDLTDSMKLNFDPGSQTPTPETPGPENPTPSPGVPTPGPEDPTPSPGTPVVSPSATPTVRPTVVPTTSPTVKPVVTPKATKVTKLTNSNKGIVVKWKKSSNASGYNVYRRTAKTKWKRITTINGRNKLTYTDKSIKAKNGIRYFYTVRAFNGKKLSSPDKKGLQTFRMTAPALTKVTGGTSKKMLIKWKQNKKASGYKIQYSTSSRFDKNLGKVTIRSGKITSKTVSKLKKKVTYHVRICSYKKVNGKIYYSGWSSVKKVKIK